MQEKELAELVAITDALSAKQEPPPDGALMKQARAQAKSEVLERGRRATKLAAPNRTRHRTIEDFLQKTEIDARPATRRSPKQKQHDQKLQYQRAVAAKALAIYRTLDATFAASESAHNAKFDALLLRFDELCTPQRRAKLSEWLGAGLHPFLRERVSRPAAASIEAWRALWRREAPAILHDLRRAVQILHDLSASACPAKPIRMIFGWKDIIEALDVGYSDSMPPKFTRLNEKTNGPIIIGAKGEPPRVNHDKLLHWWNALGDKPTPAPTADQTSSKVIKGRRRSAK